MTTRHAQHCSHSLLPVGLGQQLLITSHMCRPRPSLVSRCLRGMGAADAEAIIAIVNACDKEEQPELQFDEWMGSFHVAFACGPPATTLDPRLQAAMDSSVAVTPQVSSQAAAISQLPC